MSMPSYRTLGRTCTRLELITITPWIDVIETTETIDQRLHHRRKSQWQSVHMTPVMLLVVRFFCYVSIVLVGYMGGLLSLGCSMDTKRRLFIQDPGNFHGFRVPKAFHFHGLLEQAQLRIWQTNSCAQRIGYIYVSLPFLLTTQC